MKFLAQKCKANKQFGGYGEGAQKIINQQEQKLFIYGAQKDCYKTLIRKKQTRL